MERQKGISTICVRWVRSGIGFPKSQKKRIRCLGLRRLHDVVELPDTASVRGLVASIPHLVEIVAPGALPEWRSVPEYSILPPEVKAQPAAPIAEAVPSAGAAGQPEAKSSPAEPPPDHSPPAAPEASTAQTGGAEE